MLSLSLKRHHHDNVADAFMSAVPMVFSSALTLATFVLVVVVVVVARFNSLSRFFLTFFRSFQTLRSGVKVSVRVEVTLRVRF